MEKTTPLLATNHWRRNKEAYGDIYATVSAINRKFLYSDMSDKVLMLQKSHAFAVLSVQTQVSNHETAFKNLFADGLPLSEKDVRERIQVVNYYKNKARYIWDSLTRGRDWETVATLLVADKLDEAHKFIIDEFLGVSTVKAPFVLAMLGFDEKMCIDTNVERIAGITVPSTVVVEKYEAVAQSIRDKFPTLARETWSPFIFQWVLFDYARGAISTHDAWFDEVLYD